MAQSAEPFPESLPSRFSSYKSLAEIIKEEQQDEKLRAEVAERTTEESPIRISTLEEQQLFAEYVKCLII